MGLYAIAELRQGYELLGYRVIDNKTSDVRDLKIESITNGLSKGLKIVGLNLFKNEDGQYKVVPDYSMDVISSNPILDEGFRDRWVAIGRNEKGILLANCEGKLVKTTWYVLNSNINLNVLNTNFKDHTTLLIKECNPREFTTEVEEIEIDFENEDKIDRINDKINLIGLGEKYTIDYTGRIVILDKDIKNITVPTICTKIHRYNFEKVQLESIKLHPGINEIDSCAFKDCVNLKEIGIPGSVKSLGTLCFENCASLSKVILNDGIETIGYGAFKACTALKKIRLPRTLKGELNLYDMFFVRNQVPITVEIPIELKNHVEYNANHWISTKFI